MLDPAALAAFRRNVAALENRAIFEIPEILARLLGESHSDGGRTRRRLWEPKLLNLWPSRQAAPGERLVAESKVKN